jgi:uncharacterized repeat protein (TIGR03803 family)
MTNLGLHRSWRWRIPLRAAIGALAVVVVFGQAVVVTPLSEAQADTTFAVLYSFKGASDGANPLDGVILDGADNLYGTTQYGGYLCLPPGCGTVFKLDTTGTKAVLHAFRGPPLDGNYPLARLLRDPAGNLYGTTIYGGHSRCDGGCGTVFKLDTTGKETVLHSFTGGATDGALPEAGLVRDAAGNLYGTTCRGGGSDSGTVFKLDRTGAAETVLHSFTGGADGSCPIAGLLRDATGNLYGTTTRGGASACDPPYGCGTVFKVDTSGNETVLYRFTGPPDGQYPEDNLVRDAAGNLYGTTVLGGASACNPPYGCGTVFRLDTTGREVVLHRFTGGADGAKPFAGLVRDAAGNLYGTTGYGGVRDKGTVFKLDTTGNETVLHSFTGPDGQLPFHGLIRDAAGNLYGTTVLGGASNSGTVFKLSR